MTWIRFANCSTVNPEILWSIPRMKNDCEEELVHLIEELNEERKQEFLSRSQCNTDDEIIIIAFMVMIALIIFALT